MELNQRPNQVAKIWNIDVSLRRDQKLPELASPPGFISSKDRSVSNEVEQSNNEDHGKLVDKRSWDIALGPIKGLPMNMFIMYMAGGNISIFPIMMVGMMFFRPIQALMGLRTTMKMLEQSSHCYLQTFIFAVGNLLGVLLAVNKCGSMGLLPTHASDWLAFVEPLKQLEFVSGGATL